MTALINAGLPDIEWRPNPRAKRLRLTLKAGRVWVTIPPRTSKSTVQKFLLDTRSWLQEQWVKQLTLKQEREEQLANQPETDALPNSYTSVYLPIYMHTWTLDVSSDYVRLKEHADHLAVPEANVSVHLRRWVKHKAEAYLPQRLAELALQYQFYYTGCTVRHARTRWGSCSRHGQINLNASLILLEPELLDYVLLHELCHTRQFNHSPLFWAEMQAVCPAFKVNRQRLKHAVLPTWWAVE